MGECSLYLLVPLPDKDHIRIGQKLSERVESFHFTHNINRFRRQMNVERETYSVRKELRKDLGSIMVLPVGLASK